MSLKEIIEEIRKLNTADQHRLKQFFVNSLASYSASEPVFKEVSERKHKEGYTCTPLPFDEGCPFREILSENGYATD